MSKNNVFKTDSQNYQHGKVSLQTAFWIVGITVGVLSIAQTAFNLFDSEETQTVSSQENKANEADITDSPIEPSVDMPPKLTALDSPSIKVDNYTAYDSGVVVDETLGIMWMRCSLGQQWDGADCIGDGETYNLEEAEQVLAQVNTMGYAGLYDWQVPDIQALHSLIYCSEGYDASYEIILESGQRQTVDTGCTGSHITPAIKANVFPNTQWAMWRGYLSSSINDEGEPLVVYFNTGQIEAENKAQYVRAVRYSLP